MKASAGRSFDRVPIESRTRERVRFFFRVGFFFSFEKGENFFFSLKRDYKCENCQEGDGLAESGVRLAFALFLEITLFVVLLSLYSRVENLHVFTTPISYLLPVCHPRNVLVRSTRFTHLACLPLTSRSFSPSRFRYPSLSPKVVHAY